MKWRGELRGGGDAAEDCERWGGRRDGEVRKGDERRGTRGWKLASGHGEHRVPEETETSFYTLVQQH